MTRKIYIVDGSALIKHNLEQHLKSSFEIKTGSFADQALLEIIDWEPDILISGVEIGNITGFDLCIILKMIPRYASKPFILLSSQSPEGISEKAKEVGADLYLEKRLEALTNVEEKILALLPLDQTPIGSISSILLVDDSPIIRLMIKNMLEGIGIAEIGQANDGVEALEILATKSYDIMITDYHMPNMDGPELIKTIRQTLSGKEFPIILATGLEDSKIGKEFDTVDIQAIMTKPLSVSDLRHAIKKIASLPS